MKKYLLAFVLFFALATSAYGAQTDAQRKIELRNSIEVIKSEMLVVKGKIDRAPDHVWCVRNKNYIRYARNCGTIPALMKQSQTLSSQAKVLQDELKYIVYNEN